MRIAHRKYRSVERTIVCRKFGSDKFIFVAYERHVFHSEIGSPHIDADTFYDSVNYGEFEFFYTAGGLCCDSGFSRVCIFEKIFTHTSDSIAAHHSFRTVGIKHTHTTIRFIGGHYEYESVGTDSEMTVAYSHSKPLGVIDLLPETIYKNVVVARTVHLYKLHNTLIYN